MPLIVCTSGLSTWPGFLLLEEFLDVRFELCRPLGDDVEVRLNSATKSAKRIASSSNTAMLPEV